MCIASNHQVPDLASPAALASTVQENGVLVLWMVPQTAVKKAVVVTFQIEMPQMDFLKLAKIDIKKHFLFF